MTSREQEAQKCGSFMKKGFVFVLQAATITPWFIIVNRKLEEKYFQILLGPKAEKLTGLYHSKGAETLDHDYLCGT